MRYFITTEYRHLVQTLKNCYWWNNPRSLQKQRFALIRKVTYIPHDLLYVEPRVLVSRRTLQCRVRHLTPTYVMTNELQLLNLCCKAEKQLQNENHTEDWALGSHPRDNGHVTNELLKAEKQLRPKILSLKS